MLALRLGRTKSDAGNIEQVIGVLCERYGLVAPQLEMVGESDITVYELGRPWSRAKLVSVPAFLLGELSQDHIETRMAVAQITTRSSSETSEFAIVLHGFWFYAGILQAPAVILCAVDLVIQALRGSRGILLTLGICWLVLTSIVLLIYLLAGIPEFLVLFRCRRDFKQLAGS